MSREVIECRRGRRGAVRDGLVGVEGEAVESLGFPSRDSKRPRAPLAAYQHTHT